MDYDAKYVAHAEAEIRAAIKKNPAAAPFERYEIDPDGGTLVVKDLRNEFYPIKIPIQGLDAFGDPDKSGAGMGTSIPALQPVGRQPQTILADITKRIRERLAPPVPTRRNDTTDDAATETGA